MSNAPQTPEQHANALKILRNGFIFSGLVVFPVLTICLFFFGEFPESHRTVVMAIPIFGIIGSIGSGVCTENLRRKVVRGEMQSPPDHDESSSVNLGEALVFLSLFTVVMAGAYLLISDVKRSGLAENLEAAETKFDLESARSAKMMIETMAGPVLRAVFVPATEAGPRKGIVCATKETGEPELYTFGKKTGGFLWLGIGKKPDVLGKVQMNADIEAALSPFCDAAFSKIGED